MEFKFQLWEWGLLCWIRKGGNFTTVGRVFFNIYQDFSTFMIQGGVRGGEWGVVKHCKFGPERAMGISEKCYKENIVKSTLRLN